jgi:hypothetical protein
MSGFMVMRKAIPAAMAAGGLLLLTACGAGDADSAAADTTTTTTTTTVSSPPSTSVTEESTPDVPSATSGATGGASDMEPVDCGAVSLGTQTKYHLIAAATDAGIVGCTEAFNVADEFVKLPPEKRAQASLGNVTLASGWSCTVDDGVSANLSCEKDGFALHTEEA